MDKRKLEIYYQKLKVNPDAGKLWLEFAFFLNKENYDSDLVVKAFEKASYLLPDKDLRLSLGNSYIKAGNVEKGISIIEDSLKQKALPHGFCFLANGYIIIEKYEEAIKAGRKAIEINPKYEEAYFLLGEAFSAQSRTNSAIKCYRKAIELDPTYQEACSCLGKELIYDDGTIDEGIKYLQKAIDINNNDGWSMLYLANAFWIKGEEKKAEEFYKKSIEIFPTFPNVYIWYADFLNSVNKEQEAEKLVRKAMKEFPSNVEFYIWYTNFLIEDDRILDAEWIIKRAMENFPNNKEVYKLYENLDC